VQKEQIFHSQAKRRELPPELIERVRPQVPANQRSHMFGTEIDGNRSMALQWKRVKADCTDFAAHGASIPLRAYDERITFAHDQHFLAVGAVGFPGNTIPGTFSVAAAATGYQEG
jgi:hypothetical protein